MRKLKKFIMMFIVTNVLILQVGCNSSKDTVTENQDKENTLITQEEKGKNELTYSIENDELVINYKIDDIHISEENKKKTIIADQLTNYIGQEPYIEYNILLPEDTTIDDMAATFGETNTIKGKLSKVEDSNNTDAEVTNKYFISENGWQAVAWIQDEYGYLIAHIEIFPIRYSDEAQQVEYCNTGSVRLTLTEKKWNTENLDTTTKNKISKLVDNSEDIN